MLYLIIFILLLFIELLYFRLAKHRNIIDKPNERSLHTKITIRGGGIIFPLSAFLYFCYSGGIQYPYFFVGLFCISTISFLDDIYTLSNRYRITIQFLSIFFLIYELSLYSQIGVWIVLLMIVLVGIINAYNFMDGINGITGGYSSIIIACLLYTNIKVFHFIDDNFLWFLLIGLLVFSFFNFRKKAICFAGDIGSISIAFIITFLLAKLIVETQNLKYIFFLTIYGIDTIFTIVQRLILKQNIFQAHKLHLFQLLVYKRGFSHLNVSILYMGFQLLLCIGIIQTEISSGYFAILFLISVSYFIAKKQILLLK